MCLSGAGEESVGEDGADIDLSWRKEPRMASNAEGVGAGLAFG